MSGNRDPEVEAAFAALPSRITRKQIADATGRGVSGVQNWINHQPTFPAPVDAEGRTQLRDRDQVLAWYLQTFAGTERRGPKAKSDTAADRARAAVPPRSRLSMTELAGALKLERVMPYTWAVSAGPDSPDPFPPADVAGRREWAAVRAWLLRKDDPLPDPIDDHGTRDPEQLRQWVLRNATEPATAEAVLDEDGLTLGQRDAVERARLALAAGQRLNRAELARATGLKDAALKSLLTRKDRQPSTPQRLGPTALAREVGVSLQNLKWYIRAHPADSDDPFPSKDELGRDVQEVRDWLGRRGLANSS